MGPCICSSRRAPARIARLPIEFVFLPLPGAGPAADSIGVILIWHGFRRLRWFARHQRRWPAWRWCRTRRRPSSTACRAAPSEGRPGGYPWPPGGRRLPEKTSPSLNRASGYRPGDGTWRGRQDDRTPWTVSCWLRAHTGHDFFPSTSGTPLSADRASHGDSPDQQDGGVWSATCRRLAGLDLLFQGVAVSG